MSSKGFFCSLDGGTLSFVTAEGEQLLAVAVPSGMVPCAPYAELDPGDCEWVLKGLTYVPPRRIGGCRSYGDGAFDSAANPDYRPTSASRLELELREQIKQAQMLNRTVASRMAALQSLQAMPVASAVKEDPVVE